MVRLTLCTLVNQLPETHERLTSIAPMAPEATPELLTHGATSSARQQLLDAYRAMVPVKDVVALLKREWSEDGDAHWSSLATQVRSQHTHICART